MTTATSDVPWRTYLADKCIRPLFKRRSFEGALLGLYGVTNLRQLLKLAPPHYLYTASAERICTRHGVTYQLDLSTYHGWRIYFYRSLNEALKDYACPGDMVLDIGANIGETALGFATRVGADGRVIAFEPYSSTFECLANNVRFNPTLPVTAEHLALGDLEGEVTMDMPDTRNAGTVFIAAKGRSNSARAQRVPMTTLDNYVERAGLSAMNLIKLDVEGYEIHVLKGGAQALARFRPLLLVEVYDHQQRRAGFSAKELLEWIRGRHYRIEEMQTGRLIDDRTPTEGCCWNVVCRPVEKIS